MRILSHRAIAFIAAAATALTGFSSAPAFAAKAAPVAAPAAPMAQGDIEVSSQRYYRRGGGYRRGIGPGAAFGIIAGTIGAVAATNAYRRNYYYQPSYGYARPYGYGYARPYGYGYSQPYGYYGGGYYRGW